MAYGGASFKDSSGSTYYLLFTMQAREGLEEQGITITTFADNLKTVKGLKAILEAGLRGHNHRNGLPIGKERLMAEFLLNDLPHFEVARYVDEAFLASIAPPSTDETPAEGPAEGKALPA